MRKTTVRSSRRLEHQAPAPRCSRRAGSFKLCSPSLTRAAPIGPFRSRPRPVPRGSPARVTREPAPPRCGQGVGWQSRVAVNWACRGLAGSRLREGCRNLLIPGAWGDPRAVEQILANLIANAVFYLDPDRPGQIEVARGAAPGPEKCSNASVFFSRWFAFPISSRTNRQGQGKHERIEPGIDSARRG